MRYRFIILAVLSFFHAISAFSLQPVVLSDEITSHTLTFGELEVLEDESKSLTITDILSEQYQQQFRENDKKVASIKNLHAAYWVRFKIVNETPDQVSWVFENLDLHIEDFAFYRKDESGAYNMVGRTGFNKAFDHRSFFHKNFVYSLQLDPGEAKTYYVRIESTHNHNPFYFKIQTFESFNGYANTEYYLLGIFYGILAIMALYNLVLFFSLKTKVYLYYVAYVGVCILISFVEDGTGFQYLWPNAPWLNIFLWEYRSILLLGSLTFYSINFLHLRRNSPYLRRLILATFLLYSVYYLFVFYFIDERNISLILRTTLYIIPLSLIYYAAVKVYQKGVKPARFFILGFTLIFIGLLFQLLRESGLLYLSDIFTVYSFYIGLIMETAVFSYALSDRIRVIKKEKEYAQRKQIDLQQETIELKDKVTRELEQRVQKRTLQLNEKVEELDGANKKLQEQAEEINRINSILDKNNWKLQKDIKKLSAEKVLARNISFEEFTATFPDDKACLKYLENHKWGEGYNCKKCGHDNYYVKKENYAYRCTKCGYEESPTAFTLFHRVKIPLPKAFYIAFTMYDKKGNMSSNELARAVNLRISTCWKFSKRVLQALQKVEKQKKGTNMEWTDLFLKDY